MKNGPYILVKAPEDYPGKKYRDKYIYEHHLTWWINIGEVVRDGHVIHHIDENKHNNHISNLEMKTIAEHTSEHSKKEEIIELLCSWCGDKFIYSARNYRSKSKTGQVNFHCCRSHQVKNQHRIRKEKQYSDIVQSVE